MEKEIRLSSNEFKALASETRAGIIRLLKQRNHTLTELSKKLHLAAPTVKQHLGVLEGAELIEEMDEGRKWKYYSLTRKGKNIFSPDTPVNVLIVIGISVLALVGLLNMLLLTLGSQAALAISTAPKGQAFISYAEKLMMPSAEADAVAGNSVQERAIDSTVSVVSAVPLEYQALLLFGTIVCALFAGYFIAKVRK